MTVNLIAAVDEDWGFGKKGNIPWFIPEDFKHFKQTTLGSICIMGRITYEEIRDKMFPDGKNPQNKPLLPNRQCIVLTTQTDMEPLGNVLFSSKSLDDLVTFLKNLHPNKDIFMIGGGKVFTDGIKLANKAYISHIKGKYDCDVFFPDKKFNKVFKPVRNTQKEKFSIKEYIKVNK